MSVAETVSPPSAGVGHGTELILSIGRGKEYDVHVPPTSLTIRHIQQQIPTKYFKRSFWRSFAYLVRDLLQIALTYAAMQLVGLPVANYLSAVAGSASTKEGRILLSSAAFLYWAVLWTAYWFVQGLNGTALWVLAHECGHQAFSTSRTINNTVGYLLHTVLLVPYHSWRITHGTHHKHTNHLTKDLVFVPTQRNAVCEAMEEAPLVMLANMLIMFVFGWPAHLVANAGGQNLGRFASHFDPSAPFFRREDYRDVVVSDVGIVAMLAAIGCFSWNFGFLNLCSWYLVPYLWVNFWLVYITYMQHSDVRLPHYTNEHWTFVRGALAAVDRDFGGVLNTWLHHINDSHIVHHLFSQMPHYNAIQVTRKHIREILGNLYVSSDKPLIKSLLHTWQECRYVVPDEGICVYRR
ncbi:putative Fatty acid desaturase [Trypanosoma vivax]|uniref:Putative oleate desaturase n=1 Tax=Trypanosoma vivax (strain Y486) TaxID=1055687 RepID=G0TRT6_TRYVY|nr:putative oleate desaturase [Trypanosoma vivax]KAH8607482.1 putative Fatty acid desaturase [Trypanosoma vivax]CCC46658.1 putative oleate desaturase [Trypanosoma vivax Y486]